MGDALQRRGLHGVGLAEVLAAAGAPKGVLYHHFPGGKTALAVAAVEAAVARLLASLDRVLRESPDPVAAVERWLAGADRHLRATRPTASRRSSSRRTRAGCCRRASQATSRRWRTRAAPYSPCSAPPTPPAIPPVFPPRSAWTTLRGFAMDHRDWARLDPAAAVERADRSPRIVRCLPKRRPFDNVQPV